MESDELDDGADDGDSPAPQYVTDQDRHDLEKALVAVLLLLMRASTRETLDRLGLAEVGVDLTGALSDQVAAEALTIATSVQKGINARMAKAGLTPESAGTHEGKAAMSDILREIDDYNKRALLPYIRSWAAHQALLYVYRNTPDPNDPTRTAAAGTLWTWTQNTNHRDECSDAAAASPAALDDLIAIADGEPPVHRYCACTLRPGS